MSVSQTSTISKDGNRLERSESKKDKNVANRPTKVERVEVNKEAPVGTVLVTMTYGTRNESFVVHRPISSQLVLPIEWVVSEENLYKAYQEDATDPAVPHLRQIRKAAVAEFLITSDLLTKDGHYQSIPEDIMAPIPTEAGKETSLESLLARAKAGSAKAESSSVKTPTKPGWGDDVLPRQNRGNFIRSLQETVIDAQYDAKVAEIDRKHAIALEKDSTSKRKKNPSKPKPATIGLPALVEYFSENPKIQVVLEKEALIREIERVKDRELKEAEPASTYENMGAGFNKKQAPSGWGGSNTFELANNIRGVIIDPTTATAVTEAQKAVVTEAKLKARGKSSA